MPTLSSSGVCVLSASDLNKTSCFSVFSHCAGVVSLMVNFVSVLQFLPPCDIFVSKLQESENSGFQSLAPGGLYSRFNPGEGDKLLLHDYPQRTVANSRYRAWCQGRASGQVLSNILLSKRSRGPEVRWETMDVEGQEWKTEVWELGANSQASGDNGEPSAYTASNRSAGLMWGCWGEGY